MTVNENLDSATSNNKHARTVEQRFAEGQTKHEVQLYPKEKRKFDSDVTDKMKKQ